MRLRLICEQTQTRVRSFAKIQYHIFSALPIVFLPLPPHFSSIIFFCFLLTPFPLSLLPFSPCHLPPSLVGCFQNNGALLLRFDFFSVILVPLMGPPKCAPWLQNPGGSIKRPRPTHPCNPTCHVPPTTPTNTQKRSTHFLKDSRNA